MDSADYKKAEGREGAGGGKRGEGVSEIAVVVSWTPDSLVRGWGALLCSMCHR